MPAKPVDVAGLETKCLDAWKRDDQIASFDAVFKVGRMFNSEGKRFKTLGEALAAANQHANVLIEIHDNGPIHATPAIASTKNVVVRPGVGYRPIIVWEAGLLKDGDKSTLFSLTGGTVIVEGLQFVALASAADARECFFKIEDGRLSIKRCSFTSLGKHDHGIAVARLESAKADPTVACRLEQCFVRGADAMAIDSRARCGTALINDSLVVSEQAPIIGLKASDHLPPFELHMVRSTLVGGPAIIHFDAKCDQTPRVNMLAWDAILARAGSAGGDMISANDILDPRGLKWKAVHAWCTGWNKFFSAQSRVIDDHDVWLKHWDNREGERFDKTPWPTDVGNLTTVEPEVFTLKAPLNFGAVSRDADLGCDLKSLPATRPWRPLITGRLPLREIPKLSKEAPTIPSEPEGVYHGEKLDLARTDLGEHLGKKDKLGGRVVMHLTGSGDRPTKPIRVKGADLILFVEHTKPASPLVLIPHKDHTGDVLIEVENGDLQMINVFARIPDDKETKSPKTLVKVSGGSCGMFNCRLHTRMDRQGTVNHLLHWSGETIGATAPWLRIEHSSLLTGKNAVQAIVGTNTMHFEDSLIVAGDTGIFADPRLKPEAVRNLQITLKQCTLAARDTDIRVGLSSQRSWPFDPILLRAESCVFVDPFRGDKHKTTLLLVDNTTLRQGIVWQGDGNVYDNRLDRIISIPGDERAEPQPLEDWLRVVGSNNEKDALSIPFADLLEMKAPFDRYQLRRLGLPKDTAIPKIRPGADPVLLTFRPKD